MRRRGGGEEWQNQENGKGCGRGWPCKRFSIRPTGYWISRDVCRTFIRDAVPGDRHVSEQTPAHAAKDARRLAESLFSGVSRRVEQSNSCTSAGKREGKGSERKSVTLKTCPFLGGTMQLNHG